MSNSLRLEGNATAQKILRDIVAYVEIVRGKLGFLPTREAILKGDDPSSATYVNMNGNACRKAGMESRVIELPDTTTTEKLPRGRVILITDPEVCGILLQDPVPNHIDEQACFERFDPHKDVDGVTAAGFGTLALGTKAYGSAMIQGIMSLLALSKIPVAGKHAVVVGRSPILGALMAMILLNANAAATVCYSRATNQLARLNSADLVVAAVGIPEFIETEWLKDEIIIIDAGYHQAAPSGSEHHVGDVEQGRFYKSSAHTPVPGGIELMTITTLMARTLESAEGRLGKSS